MADYFLVGGPVPEPHIELGALECERTESGVRVRLTAKIESAESYAKRAGGVIDPRKCAVIRGIEELGQ